jgi:hypothetical protein
MQQLQHVVHLSLLTITEKNSQARTRNYIRRLLLLLLNYASGGIWLMPFVK